MSTMSKVLVVLIFILSGVFLGVTATLFAYRTDYKTELTKAKLDAEKSLAERDAKISSQAAEIQSKDIQVASVLASNGQLKTQRDGFEGESKRWKDAHSTMQTEVAKLATQFQEITSKIEEKDQALKALSDQMQSLRDVAEAASKDKEVAEQKALDLQTRLTLAEKNLIDLEKAYVTRVRDDEPR